jgi:hypothetical protein
MDDTDVDELTCGVAILCAVAVAVGVGIGYLLWGLG